MLSFRSLMIGNREQVRDLIGILLALVVGLSGLLIVSEPLKILAPRIPMLSTEDWPGTQVTEDLSILDGWSWWEKREFYQSIVRIKNETPVVEASQRTIWYADPMRPAAEWEAYLGDSYNGRLLVAKSLRKDRPLSLLFCSDASEYPRECTYVAYWRHWYTEVTIWSKSEEDLPLSRREKLTNRIDQLIMSAPDTPCLWRFCPGRP